MIRRTVTVVLFGNDTGGYTDEKGMIAMMTLGMIMTALIWKIMIGNQIIEMLSKMIQKLFGVECGKQ